MMGVELHFDDSELGIVSLQPGRSIIGRTRHADVQIDHKRVSKRHAEISGVSGQWTIRDLGSVNGTFVNGERCTTEPRPLAHGDRVQFWRYVATLHAPALAARATPGPSAATPASPSWHPRRARRSLRKRRFDPTVAVLCVVTCGLLAFALQLHRTGQLARLLQFTPDAGTVDDQAPRDRSRRSSGDPAQRGKASSEAIVSGDEQDREASRQKERQGEAVIHQLDSGDEQDSSRAAEDQIGSARQPGEDDLAHENGPSEQEIERETDADEIDSAPPGEADGEERLDARDIGGLARRFERRAIDRGRIEDAIAERPVFCPLWGELLNESHKEILLEALPRFCLVEDRSHVEKLPFPVEVIELRFRLTYSQNYKTGLGPKVGGVRLPPHPKSVKVIVETPRANGTLREVAERSATTRVPGDLQDEGLSEEEVWRQTLEPVVEKLAAIVSRTW